MSLYEKYGGFAVIHRIVMDFYERMLDSDTLGPFFEGIEMRRLIDHQTEFIAGAMGGPVTISDDQLRLAHQRFQITHAHFDELLVVLRDTLEDAEVDESDIAALVAGIDAKRSLVITDAHSSGAAG